MSVRSGEHRSLLFSTEFVISMLIVLICYTHFLYLLIPILNMFEKVFVVVQTVTMVSTSIWIIEWKNV
jgi:hypothetical protein